MRTGILNAVFSHPAQIALCCAFVVLMVGAAVMLRLRKKRERITIPFFFTVFLSIFCLYCPMTGALLFDNPDTKLSFLSRFAITFYHTFKVFAGDGNFKAVREWLTETAKVSEGVRHLYEGLFIILCFVAIVSVTGIILSFFKDFFARMRFYLCEAKAYFSSVKNWKKLRNSDKDRHPSKTDFYSIYFFSELNSKSLALAEDIRKTKKHGAFVFFDVYERNEEKSAEIRDRALEMGAIIFKKDILAFKSNLERKCKSYIRGRVEIFLIGENESENISQAIALTERYKHRYNTQIFVWASSPESAVVLDSVNKIDETSGNEKNSEIDNPYSFKLRRVDDVERYTWRVLQKADLFKNKNGETRDFISILIVGMGKTGREILKTATWMYQMEGVRLEINAVDLTDKTVRILHAQCPELIDMNDCTLEGEAHYSIRFFDNVNIFEDDPTDEMSFRKLLSEDDLTGNEYAERLRKTTDIFVALGDDDLNIRGAMELRSLFERAKCKGFSESPRIFTQVYDSVKAQNVECKNDNSLKTHKNDDFDISFNGSFDKLYQYENVNRHEDDETAIKYHLQWCEKVEKEEEAKRDYNQYEYYRRSSKAECIHKDMLQEVFGTEVKCKHPENDMEKANTEREKIEILKRRKDDCNCERCQRTRYMEHMRWNAYMRSQGYTQPPENCPEQKVKDAIAKYHSLLIPFDKLPVVEQKKDGILVGK